jgi:hypothetical protein
MDATMRWLLDGDPAIRWQTMRDLLDAPPEEFLPEQAKVAGEGSGARLLAEQDAEGRWGHGWYSPKWTSTFYTMQLLWQLGLEPSNGAARRGATLLLDRGLTRDNGLRYRERPGQLHIGETCESAMGLAMLSWFVPEDERLPLLVANLLGEQMADGGWNCQRRAGATHASFNTTILALEGLLEWERQCGRRRDVTAARIRGEEFLLSHRMFRSHTTGEIIRKQYTMLSFPSRWHYDVLRGLDYLATAEADRDERAAESIELIRSKRRADGRWPLQQPHAGQVFFKLEEGREGSRWNTLRALRVLRWWDNR